MTGPEPALLLVLISLPVLVVAAVLLLISHIRRSKGKAPLSPPVKAGTLRIVAGMRAGEVIEVTDAIIVGRDPDRANLVLPDPEQIVSGAHCEVAFDAARQHFRVRDLGSHNGTFAVSGKSGQRKRLSGTAEALGDGVELILGSSANRIRLELT